MIFHSILISIEIRKRMEKIKNSMKIWLENFYKNEFLDINLKKVPKTT